MRAGSNTLLAEARTKELRPLRIGLLGGFSVTVGERKVDESAWRLRKAASLTKLLALAPGHRLHRERAMDLLWPELGKKAASNNLRQTLHVARRTLHPNPEINSRLLSVRGEQLLMCPERQLWVDVDAFEAAAATARRSKDPAAYRAAIELYSGKLLPEDRYEEWAESRRGELRQRFLTLLVELAGLYEERGTEEGLASVVQALQRVLAEEPTNEEAHVGLMRQYALSGRQGEALRQYGRLSEALSSGLGAEPSASTRALREEIAAGRFPADPTQLPSEPVGPPTGDTSGGGAQVHNLPTQRTSFVGREREMVELKRALAMTRLLTLTGGGGSGKTRLALEVGRDLVGAYPDGVWLVELALLSEEALVPQAVAKAVKVPEQQGRQLTEALVDDMRQKKLLLVLDNCEHLIEAAAQLADSLLSSCPHLRVLATSREALGVEGELVWRVDPLSVPDAAPDAHRPLATTGELARYEAVRLFVERAKLRSPRFELTEENAGAVVQICRQLEGMPLAIELAAARVRALSLEQIAQRLEDSLKLLRGDSRTAPQRHRTLRATLDWSYELLSEAERVLFGRLSVFAGGWTLEASEALGSGEGVGESEVLDPLSRLVDKSLVALEEGEHDGALRYTMLEPVRQYARQKLRESGEEDAVQDRHAAFFLALAEEAEPEMSGPDQEAWLRRLEREHANLRGALAWALDPAHGREPREHRTELGLRLAGALGRFWSVYGPNEGRGWLEQGLTRRAAPKPALAKALYEAGWIELFQGNYHRAIALLEEGLALFRELGDRRGVASSLINLGFAALHQGDKDRAAALRQEIEALRREPLDRWTLAWLTTFLGVTALYEGDYERSGALATESLAIYRELGDKRGISLCHIDLGLIELIRGNHEPAATLLEESVRVLRGSQDKFCLAYSIFGLAAVAAARAQPRRAARLWGVAEALREEIAVVSLTHLELHAYDYEGRVSAARNMLGDEGAWEAAFAQGRAMSAEEAAEYALSEEVARAAPESPPASVERDDPLTTDPLTAREGEVADMVAQGMSNRQIAQELYLSERTIEHHVSKILRKLGLSSRSQLSTWVTERTLLSSDTN
jgi:predicted ATPase/DNA-binding SARP family transcriptional activator/DNA-binding CsgD family transcriptional regulator